ncbi:unnamed protein product, partial [Ectocarpus sp. 4 AP-2014]
PAGPGGAGYRRGREAQPKGQDRRRSTPCGRHKQARAGVGGAPHHRCCRQQADQIKFLDENKGRRHQDLVGNVKILCQEKGRE